jgi:DNA polymerase-4
MEAVIDRLAGSVAESLERRSIAGCTVTLKVRYDDFTTVTRSATRGLPVASAEEIAGIARELLRSTEAEHRPVRLLGVTVSKLSGEDAGQLVLF